MSSFQKNIKRFTLTFLLIGIALSGYSQCFIAGSISVNTSGFESGSGISHEYVLVDDATDLILVINSTGSFTGLSPKDYRIYAINYDGTTPTELMVGSTWSGLLANAGTYCLNYTTPYDCPRLLCEGDNLVTDASGFTTGGSFEEKYVVVNSSGNIISVNTTGTFSGLAVGTYTVYAINTADVGLKAEIDDLGAWSDIPSHIAATCFQILGPKNITYQDCSVLPINLLGFNGNLNNKKVDLYWQTANEINNDYFTIERSTDGYEFTPIITTNGAGNSTTILNYSDIDYNPLKGVSYYRLKQTDFDGENSYSKTIVINNIPKNFKIYPNPNKGDFIHIDGLSGDEKVSLTDAQGKLIKQFEAGGYLSLRINLNEYGKGMYFFVITTGQDVITEKIIIQ